MAVNGPSMVYLWLIFIKVIDKCLCNVCLIIFKQDNQIYSPNGLHITRINVI